MTKINPVPGRLSRVIGRLKSRPTRREERGDFDEQAYLAANLDVQAAVEAGRVKSGWDHFSELGQFEGRALRRDASRRDKLLAGIDLGTTLGLEIGPLTAPIVSKQEGRIIYVDHADTKTLRQKYSCDAKVDLDGIVAVDKVWGEQSLQDCVGPDLKLDYVINSHVIEHVPDVVTWLEEIHSVLKPGGLLRMAIPDRRFTFDFLRAESTLADALDAYLRRTRVPLPRAILDHFLSYCEIDLGRAWDGQLTKSDVQPVHSPEFAYQAAERCFRSGAYQDTHCWVFTPLSFADLLGALAKMDLLHFACERIHATKFMEIEFIAALRASQNRDECFASWQSAADTLRLDAASR